MTSKRALLFGLAASFCALGSANAAVPGYREIQVTVAYGAVFPGGDWDADMKEGSGLAMDLGIALSPHFTAGLHTSIDDFGIESPAVRPSDPRIVGTGWTRYTGGAYGQYFFATGRISPFLGASFGIHGVHAAYRDVVEGVDGSGDYGRGYGLTAGFRYRGGQRFGAVLRVDAERSPAMADGWFYSARAGVSLFL